MIIFLTTSTTAEIATTTAEIATTVINTSQIIDTLEKITFLNITQNVYNLFAILGLILSASLWIYNRYQHRIALKIEIKDYVKALGHVIQFFLYIQNESDSPITISGMALTYKNEKFFCELLPKKIRGTKDSLIKTPMFPINLAPQQGVLLPFEFLNCQDIELTPDKKVDFEIYTNRKLLKKSLTLDQPGYLLHIRH